MTATEQKFPVVMFTMLYYHLQLTLRFADEILIWKHSNKGKNFHVVIVIMLYKVALSESVDESKYYKQSD